MAGLLDLLGLPGPDQMRQAAAPPQAQDDPTMPAFVRTVERMARRIDGIQSEYGREIYRGVMENALSQATNGMIREIPSMADIEVKRQARDLYRNRLMKDNALARVELAKSAVLRLDPKVLKDLQVTEDEALGDPLALMKVANMAGIFETPLTRDELLLAGKDAGIDPRMLTEGGRASVAAEAQAAAQEEAMKQESAALELEQKRAGHLPAMADKRQKSAEIVSQTAAGKGVYGTVLKEGKRQVESSMGIDLTASIWGPDVDSDEPRGAAGEVSVYDLGRRQLPDLQPEVYAEVWKAQSWDRIKDQMEDVPPAADGSLDVGVGHAGLDPDAQPFLIGTVLRYARDKRISLNQAFTELELPFKFSPEGEQKLVQDLAVWGADYAKRSGQDPVQIINTLLGRKAVQAASEP